MPHKLSDQPRDTPLSPATPLFHPDCAKVSTDSSPIEDVKELPVAVTAEVPVTVKDPKDEVNAFPDALTSATPVPTAVPTDIVVPIPVRVILQSPVRVSDPNEDVRPLPVASTGAKLDHAPEFQVCRPHP